MGSIIVSPGSEEHSYPVEEETKAASPLEFPSSGLAGVGGGDAFSLVIKIQIMKESNWTLYFLPYTKMNLKWIKVLNVKTKRIRENKFFCDTNSQWVLRYGMKNTSDQNIQKINFVKI